MGWMKLKLKERERERKLVGRSERLFQVAERGGDEGSEFDDGGRHLGQRDERADEHWEFWESWAGKALCSTLRTGIRRKKASGIMDSWIHGFMALARPGMAKLSTGPQVRWDAISRVALRILEARP